MRRKRSVGWWRGWENYRKLNGVAFVNVRVAGTNKYTKIAPDFGSSSRRANGSILSICDFWRNAEDGPKDKSAVAD